MFSRLVIVALLSVASATSVSTPTAAPSAAPTSVPTSTPDEPDDEPTPTPAPAPTKVPADDSKNQTTPTAAPTDAPIQNGTGDDSTTTASNGTAATTTVAVEPAKTTFTAKLKLQSASDYDESKYLQALAAASGAAVENIRVISVGYAVTTQYKFADDVTAPDVVKAVAKQLSLAEDKVNATVASVAARRLREGRRLAVTADVTISADSATAADAALAGLNNTAALATEMNVTAPEVVSSGVTVSVVSEITSTTGAAVAAPEAASVASEYGPLIGKPVEVEITDVEKTESSAASTTAAKQDQQETSGAPAKVLATPITLLVVAVSRLLL